MADVTYTPNQVHRHGMEQYEAGVEYQVPLGLATYFVANRWGSSPDVDTDALGITPTDSVLEVHDAASGQESGEVL